MKEHCEIEGKISQERDLSLNLISRLDMIEANYKKYADAYVNL